MVGQNVLMATVSMDKAFLLLPMEDNTSGSGRMANDMDKALILIQMEDNTLVSGRMVRVMDKALIFFQMEHNTLVSSKMAEKTGPATEIPIHRRKLAKKTFQACCGSSSNPIVNATVATAAIPNSRFTPDLSSSLKFNRSSAMSYSVLSVLIKATICQDW